MAESTKAVAGGLSAPSGVLIRGSHPRVPNDGDTTDLQSGSLRSVEVSITSAQILALRATPALLVAALSGSVIQFLGAMIIYDYAIAYSQNGGNTDLIVENGSGTDVSEELEADNFVTATSDQIRHMVPAIAGPVLVANSGLYLKNVGSAEMITGTSVFRLKIIYAIHPTGL